MYTEAGETRTNRKTRSTNTDYDCTYFGGIIYDYTENVVINS